MELAQSLLNTKGEKKKNMISEEVSFGTLGKREGTWIEHQTSTQRRNKKARKE